MEKMTVLCISLTVSGHTNATIGIATALRNRGHTIVFAADRSRKGTFSKLGFHEEIYEDSPDVEFSTAIPELKKNIMRIGESLCSSTLSWFKLMICFCDIILEHSKYSNERIKEIVAKWTPNVIIEDRIVPMAALVTSNIPLIRLCSLNPLFIFDDDRLPPAFSGLPLDDKSDWEKWRKISRDMMSDHVSRVSEWLHKEDKSIPKVDLYRQYLSTNLNIFVYPKSLVSDYLKNITEAMEEGSVYAQLDYCMRESDGKFDIPQQLKDRPGKLIFVSMGTIGPTLFDFVMRKLVSILAKSNHRFILSKGYCEETYEAADNIWCEPYLPQLDILPHVDLVIFHGGNNTFVESLYFGKPMIILPLFADQFDNAQRVVEKEIGLAFNPFIVEQAELNTAIESLLHDSKVATNVKKISQEMRESDSMNRVVERIEYVANHPKFPTITGICDHN